MRVLSRAPAPSARLCRTSRSLRAAKLVFVARRVPRTRAATLGPESSSRACNVLAANRHARADRKDVVHVVNVRRLQPNDATCRLRRGWIAATRTAQYGGRAVRARRIGEQQTPVFGSSAGRPVHAAAAGGEQLL